MGSRRVDTIQHLIREGYWLRVRCKCGNDTRLDPKTMWRKVGLGTRIEALVGRFKCSQCGSRRADVAVWLAPGDG